MSVFRFDRLSVAQRILAGFGVVLVLLMASSLATFVSVTALNTDIAATAERVRLSERTSAFELQLNETRRVALNYLRTERGEILGDLKAKLITLAAGSQTLVGTEPPRISRRLQLLRGWSHDEANSPVFP